MAVEAIDRAMRGQTSPVADLGGRGRRHRLAARRAGGPVRGAAARARRGQARDPRHLYQGALGRVPGAGLDRPGAQAGHASDPSCATPRTSHRIVLRTSHHTHYVIGSGANDPQKYDPTAQPRDARPLDPVHLHGRAAGRRLGSQRVVRARARGAARHRRALAQGHDGRGRRVDPPLPLERSRREGVRRPRRDHPDGRRAHRRRDRRRRRAPARRAAVRARRLRPQVPHARRAACSTPAEIDRFLGLAERLPELTAAEVGELNVIADRPAGRTGGTVLMLHSTTTAAAKRADFRARLASGELIRMPGAFNPLSRACSSRTRASRASTSRAPC